MVSSRNSAHNKTQWVRYASAGLFALFGRDIVAKYLLACNFLPL
ncbi:hypothetical protein SY89_01841 [Halolamina pelagica]|uniref:Uncharacterized protein n=1 Tax=Halolamina pelagica TaxID=699431 RepID=A0A0N8I022_9EURY|nr:hypothetical protein [Halolamina pelagica]KPN31099.1 hypothetical protein SY89_01841 [Halolamina pelagica]